MNNIIISAKRELTNCKKTSDIRKLSATLFRGVSDKTKDNIFSICNELLEQHDWAMGVIAYDFAYRIRKQYDDTTFPLFEGWLEKYVRGWGDCDDFCTHAFGELIIQQPQLFAKVKQWTERDEFWMRRASAVILIPAINKDHYKALNVFEISDRLMKDEHDLVRKGYGWMLKVMACKEQKLVVDYLIQNQKVMPRVAFRYAIEKMDIEHRDFLMKI